MNKNKQLLFPLFVCSIALATAGCSKEEPSPKGAGESVLVTSDPVTLKMLTYIPFSDEDFELLVAGPVKKKYPNITVENVKVTKETQIDKLVAAGDIPDLITFWNGGISTIRSVDLLMDLAPLAKKHDLDINRFDPVMMGDIQNEGMLYGIPFASNFNALYYNKDLFDKFGISYPADGMTWEDAIALEKKLTRLEGGVQYRGLDVDHYHRLGYVMSLQYIDPKTNKASVNNDLFRRVIEVGRDIYSVPGNGPIKDPQGDFIKDKNWRCMQALTGYICLGKRRKTA